MKKTLLMLGVTAAVCFAGTAQATEFVYQFNSPAFNGVGYSSHALTIYNMELSRKLAVAAEQKAAILQAENDAKNTTMARFISNLESRIYNELARQITEKLFSGVGEQVTGKFAFNGGTIEYRVVGNMINVTITDSNGTVTTVTVPMGDFGWLKP
jgi:hypothetical protein